MNNEINNMNNSYNQQQQNFNQIGNNYSNKNTIYIGLGIVIALVVGIVSYFIFFNGSGSSKTLSCTQTNSLNIVQEMTLNFNKEHFVDGTLKITIDKYAVSSKLFESYYQNDNCKKYENKANGFKAESCNQQKDDDKVVITVKLVSEKDEVVKDEEITEGKEYFESQGFTCN